MRLQSIRSRHDTAAFTLNEALLVLAIVIVLAGLLIPAITRPRDIGSAPIRCQMNLKNITSASAAYAIQNQDRFPWTNPGSEISPPTNSISDLFEQLKPFVGGASTFVCPTDSRRWSSGARLQASNLSYFINLSSQVGGKNQVIFGDRHLATNQVAVGQGRIVVAPETALGWTHELHRTQSTQGKGVVGFTDGHAEILKDEQTTRDAFDRTGRHEQSLVVP